MRVSQPGPVGQLGRLSETVIASARSCSCSCGIETALAFAGAKWAFWFSFRVQWCCWFQRRHVVAPRARKSSPCGAASSCMRENIRPARSKHPKIGVFSLAGRTISRKSHWRGCAGRVFSRQSALRPGLVGDVAREAGCGGGFAALEALPRRVVGVSGS